MPKREEVVSRVGEVVSAAALTTSLVLLVTFENSVEVTVQPLLGLGFALPGTFATSRRRRVHIMS